MTCKDDIRAHVTYINTAIVTALLAAIASYTNLGDHGSHANGNVLNAVHWVLVILLVGAYIGPKKCIRTDVEVTWLAYGFLFGEIDMEDAMCSALVIASALTFHLHRRQALARESTDVVAAPLPADGGVDSC